MKTLHNILHDQEQIKHAVSTGVKTHAKLQKIVIDSDGAIGDAAIIKQILNHPHLVPFFAPCTQTEVPIAGYLNGRFVSRRIDRLCINHEQKSVDIIDYKTDVNPDMYRDKYILQIREYIKLVQQIYPTYSVRGHLLWTHDFVLETV